jgi:hypothetical protein
MMKRLGVVVIVTVVSACGTLKKAGTINQYVNPAVTASGIKRISLIGDGRERANKEIITRARTRLTEAGITLVVRSGSWESNEIALKDICVQRPQTDNNVDGVVFIGWDHVTLHDCATMGVATNIVGKYAGIDAMTDKLISYLGANPVK